jgi:hypothetical protein
MHRIRFQHVARLIEPPIAIGDFGYPSGIYSAFPPGEFPEVIAGDLKEVALCAIGPYAIFKKDGGYEGSRINTPLLGNYYSLPNVILSANPDQSKNSICDGELSGICAIVKNGCQILPEGSELPLYFENRQLRTEMIDTNLVYHGEPIPVIHMTHKDISHAMNQILSR